MKYIKLFEEFTAKTNESYVLQELEDELGVVLDLYDMGDHLVLSKIEIPKDKRGSGIGSKAMQKIIDFADAEGKDIRLTPSTDFGASSVSRLKKFYKGFDFVNKPKSDFSSRETMIRYAQ
jgi:predicted GNAT family acetyltransferase